MNAAMFSRSTCTSGAGCALVVAVLASSTLVAPATACDEQAKRVVSGSDASRVSGVRVLTLPVRDHKVSIEEGQSEEPITYLRAVGAEQTHNATEPARGGRYAVAAARATTHGQLSEDQEIAVVIDNGEVTVRVNGKEVPPDRIRHEGGRVFIADDQGREIGEFNFDFHVGEGPHGPHLRGLIGSAPLRGFIESAPRDDVFRAAEGEQPKVMLGIHMEAPGAALEAHLGLEPGTAALISALYGGLPAHEAGLRQYDVIAKIDGRAPADPQSLRKALKDKQPGDVIRLDIIHEGRHRTLEVKLAEYDAAAMRDSELIGEAADEPARLFGALQRELGVQSPDRLRDLVVTPDHRVFEWVPDMQRQPRMRMHDFLLGEETSDDDPHTRLERLEKRLQDLSSLLERADKRRQDVDPGSSLDRLEERLKRLEQRLDKLLDRAEEGNS